MIATPPPPLEPLKLPPAFRFGAVGLVVAMAVIAYVTDLAPAAIAVAGVVAGAVFGWMAARSRLDTGSNESAVAKGAENEALLPSLVAAMELPAVVLDPLSAVVAHNGRARELFQHVRAGQALSQLSRNPELLSAVADAIRQNQPRTLQMVDRMPLGRRLLVSVSPIGGGGADGSLLLLQFRDLTEQDRLAQMRSDFIANASHELRTPLAALKGFIETLRGPARNDQVSRERFLTIMEAQAARMARILDDLLSLSRIEMRAHLAPEDVVEVSAIVRGAAHGLEPLASEAGIRLTFSGADVTHRVRGDRDELEQVFQNLIHNAIKYGHAGGCVDVSITETAAGAGAPARVAISVADDGPGIAEEHLPRLTERFYRVDTSQSRERGGTGLGLSIVKHILNRHRGELDIQSEVGKGSTFTVRLVSLGRASAAKIEKNIIEISTH